VVVEKQGWSGRVSSQQKKLALAAIAKFESEDARSRAVDLLDALASEQRTEFAGQETENVAIHCR